MTILEDVYALIDKDDIHINEWHFSDTKKAACVQFEDYKTIVVDKSLIKNKAEELPIITEEYFHYATCSLYLIESNYNHKIAKSNRIKYEGIAKRWTIEKLVPEDELRRLCNEIDICDTEIAEYFNVDIAFLYRAKEYYFSNKG